jgi:hypothetical protein
VNPDDRYIQFDFAVYEKPIARKLTIRDLKEKLRALDADIAPVSAFSK